MTNNELFAIVRQIVMLVTELPDGKVIIRDPNAPAPQGEYCSVDVNGSSRRYSKGGYRTKNIGPVSSPIGDVYDIEQTVTQHVLRDVSLNFYRGQANDRAVSMLGASKRFDVHELLIRNKLGLINTGPVNDLTALQSNQFETRAELTITIGSLETQVVTGQSIYQSDVAVENESGNQIAAQTIASPTE